VPTGFRGKAVGYVPLNPTLPKLVEAARGCKACDLWKRGTQTVFGEGGRHARVMFIGELPGDKEDLLGKPFVGPAGRLLDKCLEAAGIDRSQVYVTNAVKHFKWAPRGKRRIHKKPNTLEIARLPALAGRGDRRPAAASDRLSGCNCGASAAGTQFQGQQAVRTVGPVAAAAGSDGHRPSVFDVARSR